MKKISLWTVIPFGIGVVCIISYDIIGSYVKPDGMLVEPFFLIPIAWLFFIISIIAALVILIKRIIKKIRKSH